MPISFPASPTTNQTYTYGNRTYKWTGAAWEFVSSGGSDSRWDLFLPPAPTSVTASSGATQATVSWTAPTVLSQTPITDYTVQYSSNSGSTWANFTRSASTAASATVTGLTNGTAYVFRVSATNGVGTGAYSTQSAAVTAGADPLFSSVSLLLHMDGSGSAFSDSSATPKTITVNGTPTQSATQSKFSGKSLALNGASALRIASNSAFGFGTGDFTVEFFLYYTGGNGYVFFYNMNNGSGSYASYGLNNGTKRPFIWNDSTVLQGNTNVTNDTWQHHAVVRSSGVLTLYLDGVAIGSTSFGNNLGSSTVMDIGDNGGGAQRTNGYIDEFRVTKGAARYLANFTPPSIQFLDA
jgi:hypothetical protein